LAGQDFEPQHAHHAGAFDRDRPGQAALLEASGETGSIAAAGRRLGMSYRRARVLVKTMNARFRAPLIEAAKGGPQGGGAQLTEMGRDVLARYRRMAANAIASVAGAYDDFRKLMVAQLPAAEIADRNLDKAACGGSGPGPAEIHVRY